MKGIGGSRSLLRSATFIALIAAIGLGTACTAKTAHGGNKTPTPTVTSTTSASALSTVEAAGCDAPDGGWEDRLAPSTITARLVGRWQLCSQKDSGIEFTASRHWYTLGGTAPSSFARVQGSDTTGPWSLYNPGSLYQDRAVELRLANNYASAPDLSFAIKAPLLRIGGREYVKIGSGVVPPIWPDLTPDGFTRRAGVQAGFAIDIPKDWKGGWFEGTWDFEPKGLPSTAEDGNTFALTVTVERGRWQDAFPGAQTTQIAIEGRNALATSPDATHTSYAIDWQTGYQAWSSAGYAGVRNLNLCPDYSESCSADVSQQRLIIRMFASNDSLWSQYQAVAQQAALTVRWYEGSDPVYGTMKGTTKMNLYARALARFMDARVEGVGADDLMCCSAPKAYASLGLYQSNGSAMVSYEASLDPRLVKSRPSEGFNVTVHFANGKTRVEFINVGFPGGRTSAYLPPKIAGACTGC